MKDVRRDLRKTGTSFFEPEMGIMLFFYNYLMLIGTILLSPIWIPLILLQNKRRRTVGKRLYIEAVANRKKSLPSNETRNPIWIHALSVGEVLSAEPLVCALEEKHGKGALVFTASTLTGYGTAIDVIGPHVHEVRYFPYDFRYCVNRALDTIGPRRVVIVETDIWPNFLDCLGKRRIPVFLVNARLSEKSFLGYKRARFIMSPSLAVFCRICLQTHADWVRFRDLGVCEKRLQIVGNMKFDQPQDHTISEEANRITVTLQTLFYSDPLWIAGSTHEGEEEMLTDVYQSLCRQGVESFLIVAPRDPVRAAGVCDVFIKAGIQAKTLRQVQDGEGKGARVVVVDRIGILRYLYPLAAVAFVGGSLVNAGGHNPLEPASVSKPILFGPHTEDFQWVCRTLVRAGGAMRVDDAHGLAGQVRRLLSNKKTCHEMGLCAHNVFLANQGAVARTMRVIEGSPDDEIDDESDRCVV